MCKTIKRELNEVIASLDDIPENVKLICYWLPVRLNGFTRICGRKRKRYIVGMNLYRRAASRALRRFYLYVTLFHELEHVRLCENIGKSCNTMNQWYIQAEHLVTDSLWKRISGRIAVIDGHEKKRKRNARYQSSTIELRCIYCGYANALDYMGNQLSVLEQEKMGKICESVALAVEHLMIDYTPKNVPVNKFPYRLKHLEKQCRKKKLLPSQNCLELLYNDNWCRKNLREIYSQRLSTNIDLVDGLLFHIFMYSGLDFVQEFQENTSLRLHMERLINDYIRGLSHYASCHQLAAIYLSEDVLKDNNAIIAKEVLLLKKRAKQHGLKGTEAIMVLK